MHVGIKVPNWGPLAGPRAVARVAEAADERGFGSVWVSDHVAIPAAAAKEGTGLDARTPFLDALTTLAYLAGRTTRVQLGTGVYVLPLRHPIVVAKEAGGVDILSDGRLVLGVGAGWLREEFELLGAPFGERGRRTDEAIDTLRDCWGAAPSGPAVQMWPRPARSVPIVVGGHSPAALTRAVRRGDGWYASGLSVSDFGALATQLAARIAAERPGERLLVGTRAADVSAPEARRVVDAYGAAGAHFVILDTIAASVNEAVEWVHRTADTLGLEGAPQVPLVSARTRG
ncbi:LLM class flavin-dependent oxidoreductase [Intrasporangium mesophilum]